MSKKYIRSGGIEFAGFVKGDHVKGWEPMLYLANKVSTKTSD